MIDNNIRKKYKLSDREHTNIYKTIENEVFNKCEPSSQPIAIIVGGQPGSGKGSVISYSKKEIEEQGKCIIIITTDEYKPYHPNAIEVARRYPTEYVEIIEQDAGLWTGKILKKAIDDKYNFIFILLLVDIQVDHYYLLKMLSFFHCRVLDSLSKIKCP